MATPNLNLISAIRSAAKKINTSEKYQWGHMGSCNCGHLAQELTELSRGEIHAYAMRKYGDWSEQSMDYCPTSGLPMDLLISEMIDKGLDLDDFRHLEKLSDPKVLMSLPAAERNLQYNTKKDVVLYLNTWANLLEETLMRTLPSPSEKFNEILSRSSQPVVLQ